MSHGREDTPPQPASDSERLRDLEAHAALMATAPDSEEVERLIAVIEARATGRNDEIRRMMRAFTGPTAKGEA